MSDNRDPLPTELAECPCTGRNLDKLIQPAVLAVLAGKPLHGYRIVRRLAEMPTFGGHEPDNTGVYRFLKAMEDRGLVTSAWDMSDSGPAKKLFDLTDKGRDCLGKWAATIREYRKRIGGLLELLEQAAKDSPTKKRAEIPMPSHSAGSSRAKTHAIHRVGFLGRVRIRGGGRGKK